MTQRCAPPCRLKASLQRRNRGFALVLVMAMVALMTLFVVAMLTTTRHGQRESNIESERLRAEGVAQNAVHVALAQLRDATSREFADGTPMPWTSQPGAIRSHAMDGSLDRLYKLYSAAVMQTADSASVAADVPDTWAAQPDAFVDLNAPRVLPDGSLRFPVIDPRARSLDPLQSVEGFDYAERKGAVGPAAGEAAQRLPMPVRWLYQLRDGTLGTLDEAGRFQGSNGRAATRANPIVARFAFWVDDETCKVNINTASEGGFWDTPRADTNQERALAATVPSRLEYMRQAGHPAGVCLSSVLLPHRRLTPLGFEQGAPLMPPIDPQDAIDLWRLGRLTVAEKRDHTAQGGTVEADWTQLITTAPMESVRQPRYAGVGELMFDHVSSSRFPNTWSELPEPPEGQRRRSQFFNRHPEALQRLPRLRAFLTAHSSAPETTLFGTPRVAMWPMHAQTLLNGTTLGDPETSRDTAFNHKVAMAAVIKGQPYFVQRSEPGNGANDFQVHASGANKRLYEYLQRLTNRAFPGFDRASGGEATFAAKFGEDRDAILIAMLDYLRSANCAEHQLSDRMQFSVLCPGVEHKGFGQVAPLQPRVPANQMAASNHPQGLGRVLTLSEVTLVITCRAEVDANGDIQGSPTTAGRAQLTRPGDRELEAGFLVETFLPGQSWTDYRPYATAALFGGAPGAAPNLRDAFPSILLNDIPLEPDSHSVTIESGDLPPSGWSGAGGMLGVRGLTHGVLQFKPLVVRADEQGQPPLLKLRGTTQESSQLKIALYDAPASTSASDLLQVAPVILPDIPAEAGLTLPRLVPGIQPVLRDRCTAAAKSGTPIFTATDVAQSLAPMHGDYRLTAMQRWVESRKGDHATPVFSPHPQWGLRQHAHNLRDSALPVEMDRTQGYLHNLVYAAPFRPDMPDTLAEDTPRVSVWRSGDWVHYSLSGALDALRLDNGRRGPALPELTGDFDNGLARAPDGPYCNRPDDGHWAALQTGALAYFDNVSQTGATVPPVSLAAFSPQRLLPSPVMFGSLPTGSRAHVPWQTLLFRPHPRHYGAQIPPDHLLLDLFWSPVLEPEPVSLGLATEGKINLNSEILPFRHIQRDTALHAAMKAEAITAIPDRAAATYKSGERPDDRFRRFIDAKATVALWRQQVFDNDRVFLTASEICEQFLVPEGVAAPGQTPTREQMQAFWDEHRLTGDNSKERPYAHLYSRLTTRSNTYRVHFIAQSLVQARSADAGTFDSRRDRVTATTSGSALLTRQLDLSDPSLPDYQTPSPEAQPSLERFYRWRIGAVEAP